MATHRCRVFLGPQEWVPFADHVELWDTLECPYEHSGGKMPEGNPLTAITGPDFKKVRTEADLYKKAEGLVRGGDWEIRGIGF